MMVIKILCKKPSVEKKVAPNVGNFNSNQIRKWYPNCHSQMLAASIVIISESGAPKQKRPPSRRMQVIIRAPRSDLITIEAANIWNYLSYQHLRKAFSQLKAFYIESTCLLLNINVINSEQQFLCRVHHSSTYCSYKILFFASGFFSRSVRVQYFSQKYIFFQWENI